MMKGATMFFVCDKTFGQLLVFLLGWATYVPKHGMKSLKILMFETKSNCSIYFLESKNEKLWHYLIKCQNVDHLFVLMVPRRWRTE